METKNSSNLSFAIGHVVIFPPSKAGITKAVLLILLIAAACYAYFRLLAPPKVTLSSYKQIQEGMNIAQINAVLGTGYLRVLFGDLSKAMEARQEMNGEDISSEFAIDSNKFTDSLTRPPGQPGTLINGTVATSEGTSNFDATGITDTKGRREIVSKEGTWKSSSTFVPARRVVLQASAQKKGSITTFDLSGQYDFCDYLMDVTVNNKPGKLIRNGTVCFSPELTGEFKSWKGKDGRGITVLFTGQRASYLIYKGPEKDFAGLPPLQFKEIAVNEEKPPDTEAVSAPEAPKANEPVNKIEQPKPGAPPPDFKKIRAELIAEYDRKFPMWTPGATVKLNQRGIIIFGTIVEITASNVVILEQDTKTEIPLAEIDTNSRCRLDPVFRARIIEQAARQRMVRGHAGADKNY